MPERITIERKEFAPMLITRQVEFSASHTCSNPALDRAANEALYGAEANPQGHGHNFVLEVTLEG
ncbi:MAG: hypothetical protein ABSE21_02630, partial [Bryobacteraceae bacterium]